jgi:hypothetical protein
MTLLAALLFGLSAGVLVYTYLGYPLVLALVARRREAAAAGTAPTVSVIVAALNEAG